MSFETLRLKHIGANADDGLTLLQDIESKMRELALLTTNDLYTPTGKIKVDITLLNAGDGCVHVTGICSMTPPRRKEKAVFAQINEEGELVHQKAEQLALPINRGKRVERSEVREQEVADDEDAEA